MLSVTHSLNDVLSKLDKQEIYGYEDKYLERSGKIVVGSNSITNIDVDSLAVNAVIVHTAFDDNTVIESISVNSKSILLSGVANSSFDEADFTVIVKSDFHKEIIECASKVRDIEMTEFVDDSQYAAIQVKDKVGLTGDEIKLYYAEFYFIISEFLLGVAMEETGKRVTMKEYRISDGVGGSSSGLAGKEHVADMFRDKAYEFIHNSGFRKDAVLKIPVL